MNIKCPYCKEEGDISTRGGHANRRYVDEETIEKYCPQCKKCFCVTVSVTYSCESSCLDRLHDMQQNPHDEKILICSNCDHFEEK